MLDSFLIRLFITALLLGMLTISARLYAKKTNPTEAITEILSWKQLPATALQVGLEGYYRLLRQELIKPNALLTLIDLSKASYEKRLYVLDVTNQKVLLQSLVAHGNQSGSQVAKRVSNRPASNQSSAGFFITKETYQGKNGYSLRIAGLQKGINDQALTRGIVIHGARYVDPEKAQKTHWVGRSQGCPAVPVSIHQQLIDLIKDRSCLFIYHPSYPINAPLPSSL
ncbi:MAG: murein L,D-transpeptidase catalytic domain family protein [Sphingomonadales bacterium]